MKKTNQLRSSLIRNHRTTTITTERTSTKGKTFGRGPARTLSSVPVVGAVEDGVLSDIVTSLPGFGKLLGEKMGDSGRI